MPDWLLIANVAVAAGTLALALATFQQSWASRRERKAARARETIDLLLGPLMPFARRLDDKFWIYKGLSMDQWEAAARQHPHLVMRLPPALVADLHALSDGTQLMQNLRNHVSHLLFLEMPNIARKHFQRKDSERNDITVRLLVNGRLEIAQIDLIELYLRQIDVAEWCAAEATRLGSTSWELEPMWGGFAAGSSQAALEFMRDVAEWIAANPSAQTLHQDFERVAARGASARAGFNAELAKLALSEKKG